MASMRLDSPAAASRLPSPLLRYVHSPTGSKRARPGKLGHFCQYARVSSQQQQGQQLPPTLSDGKWPLRTGRRGYQQPCPAAISLRDEAETSASSLQGGPDLFLLELAERLEDSLNGVDDNSPGGLALQKLHEQASEAVLGNRWPSSKDESFRFTDLRFLKKSQIVPSQVVSRDLDIDLPALVIDEAEKLKLVFVNGLYSEELSNLEDLPEEVYVGNVSAAPAGVVEKVVLPRLAQTAGQDIFASLNGMGARDVFLIVVPSEFKLFDLLHILYISTGGVKGEVDDEPTISLSSPRLLLAVGKGAEVEIVEEFVGAVPATGGPYWTNAVCEIIVDEGANVLHRYVQEQHRESIHVKQTSVTQAENSCYKHVEIGLGGRLTRHNLHVEQLGSDTITEMSTFFLAGCNQLHDLHSKLVLNHQGGFSRQLHKCIVSESSGHGVFDGNVRVNRYAQQTDAGQLSRCLLLAPRATVNVKPNLQIIADDVKCSHGAAISDFEGEQLFYFQARGIDVQTARSALVFSFGAEVIDRLVYKSLRKRVETLMKSFLAQASAIATNVPEGL